MSLRDTTKPRNPQTRRFPAQQQTCSTRPSPVGFSPWSSPRPPQSSPDVALPPFPWRPPPEFMDATTPPEFMDATPQRFLALGNLPSPTSKSLAPVATSSHHSASTSPAMWERSRQTPPGPTPLAASGPSTFRDPPATPCHPDCTGNSTLLSVLTHVPLLLLTLPPAPRAASRPTRAQPGPCRGRRHQPAVERVVELPRHSLTVTRGLPRT